MTKEELQVILDKHKKWVKGEKDGERANFQGADIRGGDFRSADLRSAYFRNADLSNADFCNANLYGADFFGADFHNVNLSYANLHFVSGDIESFTFSRGHHAIAVKLKDGSVQIQIGCKVYDIGFWLRNYKRVGREHGYNDLEIKAYGAFIALVYKKWVGK